MCARYLIRISGTIYSQIESLKMVFRFSINSKLKGRTPVGETQRTGKKSRAQALERKCLVILFNIQIAL